MLDRTFSKVELPTFRGAVTFLDAPDIPPGYGQIANNCEFKPGGAFQRYGFGSAYNVNQKMAAMKNWLSELGNYLVYFVDGTGIRLFDVTSPTPATALATASGVGAVFADAGTRLYAAIFGTDSLGATHGYVISWQSSAWKADKLFPPPISAATYTPGAPTEPSAGVVTVGTHYLAYVVEYRSGAILRMSPDSGSGTPSYSTLQPVSFTSAGSKNLSWVLNPTAWPAGAVKVHVVMTPVYNPNLFIFVPGANATVTGGASDSQTIVFNIDDDELIDAGGHADATKHRLFLTQTTAGAAPIQPHAVFPAGDRMVYVAVEDDGLTNNVGVAYVSNRNAFQEITRENHRIRLPGQLDIRTGFYLHGNVYLAGKNWTFATHDNGEDPVNWPTPYLVDGQKGTLAIRGVEVAPNGSHAWIASKDGLYYFDGQYSHLPISYWQSDVWRTINWDYAYKIQVIDIAEKKLVCVMVPLGAATTPSHILTWNYRRGFSYDKADYSRWDFTTFDPGSMALVQDQLSAVVAANKHKQELWVGPSDADHLLRQKTGADTTPWSDNSVATAFQYRTGLLPKAKPTQIIRHQAFHLRAKGSGSLLQAAYNMDNTFNNDLRQLTLSSAPGEEHLVGIKRQLADAMAIDFQMNTADSYVELSGIRYYYSPGPLMR